MPTFTHAFITGASGGLGAQLASLLAREGTKVVIAARREAELSAVAQAIRSDGGTAEICVLDVGDVDAVRSTIERLDNEVGGFDLVVANAGVGITKPAHKLSWDDVEPILRINVMGAFATIMAALTPMVSRGKGTIVGVSSLASMRGLPGSGAYSASKAALATFLETLRADLARKGIKVVDVRPGFVDTPMTRRNKFKMPFLMNVDDAGRLMLEGIKKGEAVVAFPWQVSSAMSVAETMPDALWRQIAGRVRMG